MRPNVRLHKSGRYEARIQIQKIQYSAYGDTEDEAARNLEEKVLQSQNRPNYSFGQWMEERYKPSIAHTSQKHREKANWAISHLGSLAERPIDQVDRHSLQNALNAKTLSYESMKGLRAHWSSALLLAEADDVIRKNPMRFVKLKRAEPKQKEVYDAAGLRRLIEHSRGYASHPVVILAGLMGLRIGEIQRLKPEHFKQPGKLIVPGTKTSASVRELPLHPKILEEIGDCRFPLAPNHAGRSNENLQRAAYRAQIKLRPTNHLLRHTYASLLEWIGCPLDVRARLLGHGKRTITERYSHLAWQNWEKWQNELVTHVYPEVGAELGKVFQNGENP